MLKAPIYDLFMDRMTALYNTSITGCTKISYSTEYLYDNLNSLAIMLCLHKNSFLWTLFLDIALN